MNRHDAREGKKGIGAVHVWREGETQLVWKGKKSSECVGKRIKWIN